MIPRRTEPDVLVLGASGLLGQVLVSRLKRAGLWVVTHANKRSADLIVDLAVNGAVDSLMEKTRPKCVINLVALTNVEACEQQPQAAYLLNVRLPEELADWMRFKGPDTYLLHVSTDHLYDGIGLHSEEEVVIRNTYALSKRAGELAIGSENACIIRTNFFGRSLTDGRVSLSDWLYQKLVGGQNAEVFDDVEFSPLSMTTLSDYIVVLVQRQTRGLFNLGSRDGMSKAKFAFQFARTLGLKSDYLRAVSVDTVASLRVPRPKNMLMNCEKLERVLDLKMPSLEDEILKVAYEYKC